MLSYPSPTPPEPFVAAPSQDLEEALAVAKLLLHLPSHSREFAQRAVEQLEFIYAYGLQEGNYALMSLACKCLQLGWVKASTAAMGARSWEHRHLQSHPGIAHRPDPETARLFYQAYLKVVEDPNYYSLRPGSVAA